MLPNSIVKEIFSSTPRQSKTLSSMYNLGKISFELQQDLTNAFEVDADKIKYYGRSPKLIDGLEVRQESAVEIVSGKEKSIELTAELFTPSSDDLVDGYAIFHFGSDGNIFKIEVDMQG